MGSTPCPIRTSVSGLRARRPGPLDEGGVWRADHFSPTRRPSCLLPTYFASLIFLTTWSIRPYSRGLVGRHEAVTVGILFDLLERMTGVLDHQLVHAFA